MSGMFFKWKPVADAPMTIPACAIAATITCPCAKGAKIVVTGGRLDGQWVVNPIERAIDLDFYCEIPEHPDAPKPARH